MKFCRLLIGLILPFTYKGVAVFNPETDTRTIDYRRHGYRLASVYDDDARKRERTRALNEMIKKIFGIKE